MILLLDNYDSFVHNLARYLQELDEEVEVIRHDAIDVPGIRRLAPSHLVISPGPRTPAEAGVCVEAIRSLAGSLPILGVCLGHQCIGAAFGARIVRAPEPMHGKNSRVRHEGRGLFQGLPNPLRATRYHSLVVDGESVGPELRVTAWTEEGAESGDGRETEEGRENGGERGETIGERGEIIGEIMALEHVEKPIWGVQFHPEALMTEGGHALLANFLALGRGEPPPGSDLEPIAPELPAAAER